MQPLRGGQKYPAESLRYSVQSIDSQGLCSHQTLIFAHGIGKMEIGMVSTRKIGTALAVTLLAVGISIMPSAYAATTEGSLLRGFDVPQHFNHFLSATGANYWPIGIEFNGKDLWYSQPGTKSTQDIFLTTTTGVLLRTLTSINAAGALAWDGSNLWVGIFNAFSCTSPTSGCSLVFQVSPTTGTVLNTLDISGIFAADGLGGCNIIDGLDFDQATGTLWVSPDI